jgi:hypothetical protein
VRYELDALGRRIAKTRDGAVVARWVYLDRLRPIAEFNAQHALVSRFIYADRANVPSLIVKGSTVYRVVPDLRGSVRVVVNARTGEVAQRLDYDEFGRVLTDTNPGFQRHGVQTDGAPTQRAATSVRDLHQAVSRKKMLKDSLIVKSKQAWKLAVAFAGLALSFTAMVIGLRGGRAGGSMALVLGGALSAILVLALASFAVRCRACGMHWLWAAIRHQEHSGWVTWLLTLRACPQCGDDPARHDHGEER